MQDRANKPNRNADPGGLQSRRRRGLAAAALVAGLIAAAPAIAEDWQPVINPGPAATLPEAILVPILWDGSPVPNGGWILTYRNALTGSEVALRDVESREVSVRDLAGDTLRARISWEITRTPNSSCAAADLGPCPDQIRVLSVPDGFLAVPDAAVVDEGAALRIYIVPAAIS